VGQRYASATGNGRDLAGEALPQRNAMSASIDATRRRPTPQSTATPRMLRPPSTAAANPRECDPGDEATYGDADQM
jgi:hypothetical protein